MAQIRHDFETSRSEANVALSVWPIIRSITSCGSWGSIESETDRSHSGSDSGVLIGAGEAGLDSMPILHFDEA